MITEIVLHGRSEGSGGGGYPLVGVRICGTGGGGGGVPATNNNAPQQQHHQQQSFGGGGGDPSGKGGFQQLHHHHHQQQQAAVAAAVAAAAAAQQPASHMHQQQLPPQGPPIPMTYQPQANHNRPNYFPAPRVPPQRMTRPPMVQMSMQNVPHYIPQPPQIYPTSQVLSPSVPLMFSHNQVPCDSYQLNTGRQQGHPVAATAAQGPTSNYYHLAQNPQSLITMTTSPYNTNYYIHQSLRSVFPGPTQQAAQQAPPPQQPQVLGTGGGGGGLGVGNAGGGGNVGQSGVQGVMGPGSMGVQGGVQGGVLDGSSGLVNRGVGGVLTNSVSIGPGGRQRRKHALKILDPTTGKDVVEEMLHTEETASSQSEDSSTSNAYIPQMGDSAIVAAEFAARVAAAAQGVETVSNGGTEVSTPSSGPSQHQHHPHHHQPQQQQQQHPSGVGGLHHHHHGGQQQQQQSGIGQLQLTGVNNKQGQASSTTTPGGPSPPSLVSSMPSSSIAPPPQSSMMSVPPLSSDDRGSTPVVSALTNSPPVELRHLQQHHHHRNTNDHHQSGGSSQGPLGRRGSPTPPQQPPLPPSQKPTPSPSVVIVPSQQRQQQPPVPPSNSSTPIQTPVVIHNPPVSAFVVEQPPFSKLSSVVVPPQPPPSSSVSSSPPPPQQQRPPPPSSHHLPPPTSEEKRPSVEAVALSTPSSAPPPHHQQHQPNTNSDVTIPLQQQHDTKALQKNKQKKQTKKEQLNRKGSLIEGTDMDAFKELTSPLNCQRPSPLSTPAPTTTTTTPLTQSKGDEPLVVSKEELKVVEETNATEERGSSGGRRKDKEHYHQGSSGGGSKGKDEEKQGGGGSGAAPLVGSSEEEMMKRIVVGDEGGNNDEEETRRKGGTTSPSDVPTPQASMEYDKLSPIPITSLKETINSNERGKREEEEVEDKEDAVDGRKTELKGGESEFSKTIDSSLKGECEDDIDESEEEEDESQGLEEGGGALEEEEDGEEDEGGRGEERTIDEDDEESQRKRRLMVEAKNEENSKISQERETDPPSSSSPPPSEQFFDVLTDKLIETTIIERSSTTPPQLKYTYQDGQWSPLNPEGKKNYSKEFLMDLRNDPLSTRKPDIALDHEIFKDNVANNNRRSMHPQFNKARNNFAPEFLQNSPNRAVMPQRRSQQSSRNGIGDGRSGRGGMNRSMTHSLREDVKLRESDNAWRPSRLKDSKDKCDLLYKKVRGILNKLTPQKFDTLVNQVIKLPIENHEILSGVMGLVFEKAVAEPSFSKEYALMCKTLASIQVKDEKSDPAAALQNQDTSSGTQQQLKMVNFKKLLIIRCQTEFEKNKMLETDVEKCHKKIAETADPEKKRELQLQFEEEERKVRKRSVGLVRFIGELYKLAMLTPNIMHNCIKQLISKIDEESLECLCKLLMTIGKELEKQSNPGDNKQMDLDWNSYFDKMAKLSRKSEDSKVSSRVRFMLQDVIELRHKKWVPRRDENNPKTIEQIQKDAERESMEAQIALAASQSRKHDMSSSMRSGGGGGLDHDRRRDRNSTRSGVNNQSDDGWQSVGPQKGYRNSYFDPVKLAQMKSIEQDSVLGSSNQFGRWGTGASIKREQGKSLIDNNAYSVLSDDRKGPPSSMINTRSGGGGGGSSSGGGGGGPPGKMTPSPSLEKERAFQGLKEVMLDNGRNARGGNKGPSNPPSRESSRASMGGEGGGGQQPLSSRGSSGPPSTQQQQQQQQPPQSTDHLPPSSSTTATPNVLSGRPSSGGGGGGTQTYVSTPSLNKMSEDEVERKSKTVLEELRTNRNMEEAIQCTKETFQGDCNLKLFVGRILNSVLDDSSVVRYLGGNLIACLLSRSVVQPKWIIDEFVILFESAEDLKIDLPHIYRYLAEILVVILSLEVLNFSDIRKMCTVPVQDAAYLSSILSEIFKLLIKEKGPLWIRTQWESSNVQLSDFVVEGNIDKFIADNNLSFLSGSGKVVGQLNDDSTLTMVEVEEKIFNFLQTDGEKVFEHICDWLIANIGEKTKEQSFIHALAKAVIRASTNKNHKLNGVALQKHEKLIKRFVDNDEELELACLYGIQNLVVVKMEAPQGLLQSIFQSLYDDCIISYEAFLKWKERTDKEETPMESNGKGVAVTTLSTFFVSLSEIDVEEDGS